MLRVGWFLSSPEGSGATFSEVRAHSLSYRGGSHPAKAPGKVSVASH